MLTVYLVSQSQAWNRVVLSIPNYDVFYLNEYARAFMNENSANGVPLLFYYENGSDKAINVVFKRDIAQDIHFKNKLAENKYYDLISPYGYGGFIGSITNHDALNREYVEYCRANGYVCEFVRFELFSDYYRFYSGYIESKTHNVIRNLEIPLDDMWMDFKQKVRKNVKRAISSGVQIAIDEDGRYLDDFLRIYYGTMERTEANEGFFFSKKFFETLIGMEDHYVFLHAFYDGKIISTELVIYGNENCYSYLGGTDSEYFDKRPNDLLKYEIIKWAKDKGLKNFVLGGGYGTDDGIFQYKSCLAPRGIVDFHIGGKIFDEEKYNTLVAMRAVSEFDSSSNFFPLYRA